MSENSATEFVKDEQRYSSYSGMEYEFVYRLSEEFERDSRRYNRPFTEQQEVSTK